MPNPFAHVELTTDDLKGAQAFYKKVFAWKLTEMPGMNYTMVDVQGGTGGGMQAKPMADAPTGWMPYVQVDDVKTTVAKASKAGASVMLPFQEIGEMGAIGVFRDPGGCVIGVWEMKKAPPVPAPAKKAAAPAKKAPAKKAPAPAKKAAAKKAPAKKAPAKKAAAPAKKAPAKAAKKKAK